MNITFVLGEPRHGKTTFGKFLDKYSGVGWGDTSGVILEYLVDEFGKSVLDQPKETIRHKLIDKAAELCSNDPGFLVRVLLNRGVKIIVGVRRVSELESGYGECNYVWVDRPGFVSNVTDNTESGGLKSFILDRNCYNIVNSGNLHDLEYLAFKLATELYTMHPDWNIIDRYSSRNNVA